MTDMAATMRVLHPAQHVMGFYDGRLDGQRLHGPQSNWLDDGGYSLGTCSYAIVSGGEALVYDTHMSLDHALQIRRVLKDAGVRDIRVVLSHHHLDHIAGNAVFADCEIWANEATATAMERERRSAETADPPINPVVMPTRIFAKDTALEIGAVRVELRSFEIHSHDGLIMWLPDSRELFAGDTLEDTCTYVAEPDRLEAHLSELDRLSLLDATHILPNHGDPAVIDAGGYGPGLIGATASYVRKLLKCREDPELAGLPLDAFVRHDVSAGHLIYYDAYEPIHRRNLDSVLGK